MPAKTNVFFLLLSERGNNNIEDLLYANTIPNKAAIEIHKIVPATISPLFCHVRYFTSSSGLTASSPPSFY